MMQKDDLVTRIRNRVNLLETSGGPSNAQILAGVEGFAREFNYWYIRVLKEALPKFKRLIVDRINPIVRGMELEGMSCEEVAARLVRDYAQRNFVTAGGWALEQLAIAGSPRFHKSTAPGIDAEWHEDGAVPVSHLYVIKSGAVTRNSDILAALKANGKDAHKRLIQTNKKSVVKVYYAITSGVTSSGYHDGVFRPSSAEFWAQAFGLDDDLDVAVDLALAMAQEASEVVRSELGEEDALRGLKVAVASYIAMREDPDLVDWEYLAQANMRGGEAFKASDKQRLEQAKETVEAAGFEWKPKLEDTDIARIVAD